MIGNGGNLNIEKIDSFAVDGLLGFKDSLAYKVSEIDRHLHNRERWFGAAITPNGTIHSADRIGAGVSPIRFTSGNNTWGAWVQILGTGDTPQKTGSVYFDPHRAVVVNSDMVGAHFFQLVAGPDPDVALTAGNVTEFVYATASNQLDVGTIDIMARRQPVGSQAWGRMMTPGFSGKILDAYIGIHEYEG